MKRNISYILGFIAVAMLASCMKVDIHPVQVDDTAMVSLTLKSTEPVATRADGDAVEDLNENLINSVQCFFSNDGKTILFSARKDKLNDADGTVDNLNLEISSADLANLNSTCHVFTVVNCAELSIPEDKTIATLKSSTEIALSKTDNTKQTSFVMVGTDINDGLTKADNKLSGTVHVKRVASKVNVILKVAESIQVKNGDKTETWVPYFDAPEQAFNMSFNGKANTKIVDADIVSETQNPAFTSNTDFTVTATDFNVPGTPTNNVYTVTMQVPFYTYPMSWKDQNDIILMLPWKQVAADGATVLRYATYEYQIPVQYENKKLLSNNEYELTVNVGILGNLGTTVLTPSYQVANWGTGEIDAELSRPKYLVVEKGNHVVDGVTYHYVMNNTTELTIPFHSSDDCTISSISCKQTNLSTGNVKTVDRNDNATSVTNKSFKAVLNNEAKTVTITHGVNNDLYDSTDDTNGVFDFTPYIYVLTITHDGDASFKETINIIQYPAIHGYGDENSDFNNGGGTNDDKGFVWVNGYQGSPSSSVSNFDRANGSTSQTLTAVSMYVFTVSSLLGTDYVIGDPRTQNPDNLDEYNFTWGSGKVLNSNDIRSTPLYYLPTDADLNDGENSRTYNMIAPKFRVCSVYGAINTNGARQYYKNMKGRCASYQEDGYPAGRWRLPTAAEFELINTLSMKGLLPRLYETTMDYWCAHGYGRYNTGQNKVNIQSGDDDYGSDDVSVRCVYDDWYWGSEPALKTDAEKRQFTWGDEPR